MKALLAYSLAEAFNSLRRGWRASLLALLTTTAAVFVAAAALLVSINVREIFVTLGTESELTVYLRANAEPRDRERVDEILAAAPAVASRRFVTPEEALKRFAGAVPELAPVMSSLGGNPLPASFEVRLRQDPAAERGGTGAANDAAVKQLEAALTKSGLVEDLRYDRQVFDRLLNGLKVTEQAGTTLAGILVLAAILTITSVLRLSYLTRRDEISVLYLVGAPPRAIRGPFVMEGLLQATAGAIIALIVLAVTFTTFRVRYGQAIVDAFRLADLQFLPLTWILGLLLLSAVLGALAGLGAAWRAR